MRAVLDMLVRSIWQQALNWEEKRGLGRGGTHPLPSPLFLSSFTAKGSPIFTACFWHRTDSFLPLLIINNYYLIFSSIDIDECKDKPELCQHGSCRNLVGTYICDCDSGFVRSLDGKQCEGLFKTPFIRPSICPEMHVLDARRC